MNLLSLVSGDPRLALLDSLSHHLNAVDGASLIAEKTEPTSAFEAFAVFVPDRIACTAYSDCFWAAGTLHWGRHLHHAPSMAAMSRTLSLRYMKQPNGAWARSQFTPIA